MRRRRGRGSAACLTRYSQPKRLYKGIPALIRFSPYDLMLAQEAWAYLDHVGDVFNAFRQDSEIGGINAVSLPRQLRVSADLAEAIALSLHAHQLTGGAFDIACGALTHCWRSAAAANQPPSEEQLRLALDACGSENLALEHHMLTIRRAGLRLDLGGIVKGIAMDRVASLLREGGADSGLVQLGGETTVWGRSSSGRHHVVGIRHPLQQGCAIERIQDGGRGLSASTSGNYEQPIVLDGKHNYHILSPRDGMPASTKILSATVAFPALGKTGLADALASALVVVGAEQGIPMVHRAGGEAFVLVGTADGIGVHCTSHWHALKACDRARA